MVMQVDVPSELAKEIQKTALAAGVEPERVAVAAMRRGLEARETLEAMLRPVREAFENSGLSEDEAVELFELEKHALRRARREQCP
jgi:hypothetical protein